MQSETDIELGSYGHLRKSFKSNEKPTKELKKLLKKLSKQPLDHLEDGNLPIHQLAQYELTESQINIFSDNQKYINAKGKDKKTPLHIAAEYKAKQTIDYLINSSANLSSKDAYGNIPLHYAAKHNFSFDELKVLSNNGDTTFLNNQNQQGLTPLHFAAQYNNLQTFLDLLRLGANPNSIFCSKNLVHGKTVFQFVKSSKNNPEVINYLQNCMKLIDDLKRFRPSEFQNNLKQLQHKDFIFYPSIIDFDGYLPIHYLARIRTADITSSQESSLSEFQTLTSFLSEQGKLLFATTPFGDTPFHLAAHYGELSTLMILINSAKDKSKIFELRNGNGFSVIDCALIRGHVEIAKLLFNVNPKTISNTIILSIIQNYFTLYTPHRTKDKFINHHDYTISLLKCVDWLFTTANYDLNEDRIDAENNNPLHYVFRFADHFNDDVKNLCNILIKYGGELYLNMQNKNHATPKLLALSRFPSQTTEIESFFAELNKEKKFCITHSADITKTSQLT
jgi:ankyrin repeat protein